MARFNPHNPVTVMTAAEAAFEESIRAKCIRDCQIRAHRHIADDNDPVGERAALDMAIYFARLPLGFTFSG